MLLGSGELGKEVAIELQRFGVELIAVDRYKNAPAMQVAHRSHVINMLDGTALEKVIYDEKPDIIVPEIEAIATDKLVELEKKGFVIIPTARATALTMNRENIRRLVAEELKINTSPYLFVDSYEQYLDAINTIGLPCVIKPIMSSSGKGQSIVKEASDIQSAWQYCQQGGRSGEGRAIVEDFIDFDYEITLLTVRAINGTQFFSPIGHQQEDGDYRESWQPQPISQQALEQVHNIAQTITDSLGGLGVFGVEFFIKGKNAIFSEISPRPHDTGLVTLTSQNLSEFAIHARAILGLPIPTITQTGPSASAVILAKGESRSVTFSGLDDALTEPDTDIRLFGKPEINGIRRMGVALAKADTIEKAREKARKCAEKIKIGL